MPDTEWVAEARLTAVLARLDSGVLPPLDRPPVPEYAPPTQELVAWAARLYASALVSHVRELLRSFLLIARERQTPATWVLGRAIFEFGAHAALIHQKFQKKRDACDLAAAFELFSRATQGNREMRERGEQPVPGREWDLPFHVCAAIRALDEFLSKGGLQDKIATQAYDTLSEHSHPNQGAFSFNYRPEQTAQGGRIVFFGRFREDCSAPPFAEVSMALSCVAHFAAALFELAGDDQTADLVYVLLHELD
jgi:hypothetical protein